MTPAQRRQLEGEVRWARSGFDDSDIAGTDADVAFVHTEQGLAFDGVIFASREEHRAEAMLELAQRRGAVRRIGRVVGLLYRR